MGLGAVGPRAIEELLNPGCREVRAENLGWGVEHRILEMACSGGQVLGDGKNWDVTRRVGSHNGMKDSSRRRRSPRTETSGFEKITSMETEVTEN